MDSTTIFMMQKSEAVRVHVMDSLRTAAVNHADWLALRHDLLIVSAVALGGLLYVVANVLARPAR
jgi:hypothetical protein